MTLAILNSSGKTPVEKISLIRMHMGSHMESTQDLMRVMGTSSGPTEFELGKLRMIVLTSLIDIGNRNICLPQGVISC